MRLWYAAQAGARIPEDRREGDLKKTKKYKKPEDVREGKRLAKVYLKQIKANLKKGLPWEDPGR